MIRVDGLELGMRDGQLGQDGQFSCSSSRGAYCRMLASISAMQRGTASGGAGTKVASSMRRLDPIQAALVLPVRTDHLGGCLVLHQDGVQRVDERQGERGPAHVADALEPVLECLDIALRDPHIGWQPVGTLRRLVSEQLRQAASRPLDLRTADRLAARQRARHHVGVGDVRQCALQAAEGSVGLGEVCALPLPRGERAGSRRCHERAYVRMAQGGHQVRPAVGGDVLCAHQTCLVEGRANLKKRRKLVKFSLLTLKRQAYS